MVSKVHVLTVERRTSYIRNSQTLTQAEANKYVTSLCDAPDSHEFYVRVAGPSQKNYDDAAFVHRSLMDGRD